MADRKTSEARLEIAHVLFIDIVGYSKLLTSEQRERQQELNRIVRETEQFREAEAAGKLIRVPTGDGMVLAFFTSPDAPVRCAIAISRALHGTTRLPAVLKRRDEHASREVDPFKEPLSAFPAFPLLARRHRDCIIPVSDQPVYRARLAKDQSRARSPSLKSVR